MLMLSTLHNLLSQVLSLPHLHTACLLTTTGELLSVACDPLRPKDEVRLLVGLAGEVWQETKDQAVGMVDSEFGRIVVFPVDERLVVPEQDSAETQEPLMLLALNSNSSVDWDELEVKGKALALHLAKPMGKFREYLAIPKTELPASATVSPAAIRT